MPSISRLLVLCLVGCGSGSSGNPAADTGIDSHIAPDTTNQDAGVDIDLKAEDQDLDPADQSSPDLLSDSLPDAAVDAEMDSSPDAAMPDAMPDLTPDASTIPLPPYGTTQLVVASTGYGTNTELYLKPGETVTLAAAGSWSIWPGVVPETGPEGDPANELDGCPIGSLIAQIGLSWAAPDIYCVGAGKQITANTSGILFLRINDGVPDDNTGSMTVTVTSAGARSPVIAASQIASTDLAAISAEQVELAGSHVLLTLPLALVTKYKQQAAQALATFDSWYDAHKAFVGFTPFNGQPIRYLPDSAIVTLYGYYMVSGNPILFSPAALDSPSPGHAILQVHVDGHAVWPFSHEMAHDFTIYLANGLYMIGPGPIEAWANVVNIRTLQQTGFSEGTQQYPMDWQPMCTDLPSYLSSGTYAQFRDDPWLPLCMLFEIKDQYGWTLFDDFFAALNTIDLATIPDYSAADIERWSWLRDQLNTLSGGDVTPILSKYKIPLS